MSKTIKGRLQDKHDTEANWLKADKFMPLAAETIVYVPDATHDKPRFKIGDGIHMVNELPFFEGEGSSVGQPTAENGEIFNLYEAKPDDYDARTTITIYYDVALSYAEEDVDQVHPIFTKTDTVLDLDEETISLLPDLDSGYLTTTGETVYVYDSMTPAFCCIVEAPITDEDKRKAYNEALANYSHAEGYDTTTLRRASHVEGTKVTAFGTHAHAEGYSSNNIHRLQPEWTRNTANDTIIEFWNTTEIDSETGEEKYTKRFMLAKGSPSHAEGSDNLALGNDSHAEGGLTIAKGYYAHSEGLRTQANGEASHAEGRYTIAQASAHAEGWVTNALGEASHTEGKNTTAQSIYSHAEGSNTNATGEAAHAEGVSTATGGKGAHAEGVGSKAMEEGAHSEGAGTASGWYSHAENSALASGSYSHAEGNGTQATVEAAHAEGKGTTASGLASHAEGRNTVASGSYSHAEGDGCQVTAGFSHVEGYNNILKAPYSHVSGGGNKVEGHANSCSGGDTTMTSAARYSFSHGQSNNIAHQYVATLGRGLKSDKNYQFLAGAFNAPNTNALVAIGNGTSDSARSNAFEVLQDGRARIQTAPTDDMDVVNKAYVDEVDNRLTTHINDVDSDSKDRDTHLDNKIQETNTQLSTEIKELEEQTLNLLPHNTVSGTSIFVDDVSPSEHNLKVSLTNNNINDFSNTKVAIGNQPISTITTFNEAMNFIPCYQINYQNTDDYSIFIDTNEILKDYEKIMVFDGFAEGDWEKYRVNISADEAYEIRRYLNMGTDIVNENPEELIIHNPVFFDYYAYGNEEDGFVAYFITYYSDDPIVPDGYEPVNPNDYSIHITNMTIDFSTRSNIGHTILVDANSDGTVDNIKSIYPNMALATTTADTTITCTYNQDMSKVFVKQESIAPLMVTTGEDGLATHSPTEMLEHVRNGGSVYYNNLSLTYLDENHAQFDFIDDDGVCGTNFIYADKSEEYFEYPIGSQPPLIVKIENGLSTHTPAEIFDYVKSGGSVFYWADAAADEVNDLLALSQATPSYAIFDKVTDDGFVESLFVYGDKSIKVFEYDINTGSVSEVLENDYCITYNDNEGVVIGSQMTLMAGIHLDDCEITGVYVDEDDPTCAVNKAYVDRLGVIQEFDGKTYAYMIEPLHLENGLNAEGNRIQGVSEPLEDMDAVNKEYVDTAIANIGGKIIQRETVVLGGPHTESKWLHIVYDNGDEEYNLLNSYHTADDGGPAFDITAGNFGTYSIDALELNTSSFANVAITGNAHIEAIYSGLELPFPVYGFSAEYEESSGFTYLKGIVYIPSTFNGVDYNGGSPKAHINNMTIKLIK